MSRRFDSKLPHFQRKEAAVREYVSMPEQHMCLFEACMSAFPQTLATDEILTIFSFPPAAPPAGNSYTSHVGGRRGRSAISSFAVFTQRPEESWNFHLQ